MAFEQKNMNGAIFRNEKREKDTHPTHQGSCTIDGKQYWISCWIKEDRNGGRFFSLAFKPKLASDHQGASNNPPARTAPAPDVFDDTVPF